MVSMDLSALPFQAAEVVEDTMITMGRSPTLAGMEEMEVSMVAAVEEAVLLETVVSLGQAEMERLGSLW